MTVRELMTALAAWHPDTMVVVRGYEGGFDDPDIHEVGVCLDVNAGSSVYGRHGAPSDPGSANHKQWRRALCIDRPYSPTHEFESDAFPERSTDAPR